MKKEKQRDEQIRLTRNREVGEKTELWCYGSQER